jgi:hypothetical protein
VMEKRLHMSKHSSYWLGLRSGQLNVDTVP